MGVLMRQLQCPVCFTLLAVRDVTPCHICGGWPGQVERFNPQAKYWEWRLPSGRLLVLCHACEVEEFLVRGGWGWRLNLPKNRLPLNALHPVRVIPHPQIRKDRFCPTCN